MTIWVDASAGASGDMLLGALAGAGVPVEVLQDAVSAVAPEPVRLRVEQVHRAGLAATRCRVELAERAAHRSWRDVRAMLRAADLTADVHGPASATFERLAVAEASVHGTDPLDVTFHEVGALDAIADVVGVCAGFAWLGGPVVASRVAVGSGWVSGAHGLLPVPVPAVVELLRGVPSYAGPPGSPEAELCTPTGAALLTALAADWGPQPALRVDRVGVGAGARDPQGHVNVLRLVAGRPEAATLTGEALLVQCNVDDLDPRVWPGVLDALLAAGASDAWLAPILMKKGRPAHTLSALTPADRADAVRVAIFRHTSTIGVREHPVGKHALERERRQVTVQGQAVGVKLARLRGEVVNAQPEWEDVVRAAAALGRPAGEVLADAVGEARRLVHRPGER